MSQSPEEYNLARIQSGEITPQDLTELFIEAQKQLGVRPDGYVGPVTLEALHGKLMPHEQPVYPELAPLRILAGRHSLEGSNAFLVPIHNSWCGGLLKTPNNLPLGIVCHTSDTAPGTAMNMAKRRQRSFGQDPDDRMASWHISVETDGSIVQMVALDQCAWHAGSNSAQKIPGVGWANYTTVGIELISEDDKAFPQAQVDAAKRVWRALVRTYNIPRANAMIAHGWIDPQRRTDPGAEWCGRNPQECGPGAELGGHAKAVLDYAYGVA